MKHFLVLVILSITAQGQIYAWFSQPPSAPTGGCPSGTGGTANYCDFETYVITKATVAGITVVVPWAPYDNFAITGQPSLNLGMLGSLDSALQAAATDGTKVKTINLILAAASGSSPNAATPSYVFTTSWANTSPPVDVCYCSPNYPGTGSNGFSVTGPNCYNATSYAHNFPTKTFDASGVPASWEFPFYNAYHQFAQKFAAYYSGGPGGSSISSYIGYVRFGLLTGGGTVVPCPAVEEGIYPYGSTPTQSGVPAVPLTEPILEQYATNVFSGIRAQSPKMILNASMFGGETFGTNGIVPTQWADDIASIAIANDFGITAESLASTDLTSYATAGPCSNDWCSLFNLYYPFAPMLGLQTLSISNPSCIVACVPSNTTGTLVTVLPFGTQHHTTVFEVKYEDLLCAYDQNTSPQYSSTNCPNTSPYSAPFAPYATTLANSAAGQPSSTSAVSGAASVTGSAMIQ
jgi:hypothetical protein